LGKNFSWIKSHTGSTCKYVDAMPIIFLQPVRASVFFTNHIEFYNPGGLPKPLEELKAKDLSLPRNPLITKLFRMVRLAENAGYGFDRIETNWKIYNNTEPEYDVSFDATILKLATRSQKETDKPSEKLRKNFGVTLEKLRRELVNTELNKELIISYIKY